MLRAAEVDRIADVATCAACGHVGPYVGGQRIPPLTEAELAAPPRGIAVRRTGRASLALSFRAGQSARVWLVSVASLAPLVGTSHLRNPLGSLAEADPMMLVVWAMLWGGLAMALAGGAYWLAGRMEIRLVPGRLEVFRGVCGVGPVRTIGFGADTQISLQTSDYRVHKVPQLEIVVQTDGKTLRFGATDMAPGTKKYVAAVLRRAAAGG